jgi:toxin ParE1/3/4
MGRERIDIAPLVRSFPVNNYLIFYRLIEEGIEIVRVIHGARNIPNLFE